jgi:hypothetical protein
LTLSRSRESYQSARVFQPLVPDPKQKSARPLPWSNSIPVARYGFYRRPAEGTRHQFAQTKFVERSDGGQGVPPEGIVNHAQRRHDDGCAVATRTFMIDSRKSICLLSRPAINSSATRRKIGQGPSSVPRYNDPSFRCSEVPRWSASQSRRSLQPCSAQSVTGSSRPAGGQSSQRRFQ